MQVNFSQNYKQNFGSTTLDTVYLKKRIGNNVFTPVKATFSELNVNDLNDINLIKNIKQKWQVLTDFACIICQNFLSKDDTRRYFSVETIDGANKNVTAIVETMKKSDTPKKVCEIKFLQSAPEIAKQQNLSPIKGSGELAVCEIIKLAKEEGYSAVELISVADSFYKHIGMKRKEKFSSVFNVKNRSFKNFIERIQQKFSLN